MSADIVNLNKARKARARTENEKQAEANRGKFGRTKADKIQTSKEAQLRDDALDGARLSGTVPGAAHDAGAEKDT